MIESYDEHGPFKEERVILPLQEILTWDDYGSWGEWRLNDLRGLPPNELKSGLESFRGKRWARDALKWLVDGMPAIILVEASNRCAAIADGRGRVSFAVGMGIKQLPVIVLRSS